MRPAKRIGIRLLALSFGLLPLPVLAAQATAPFLVTATLQSAKSPASGFCRLGAGPGTFGAVVNIVCATGVVVELEAPKGTLAWTPIHGGAYRFMGLSLEEIQQVQFAQLMEGYSGIGTVTSWRVVPLADRDYLEMLIGW